MQVVGRSYVQQVFKFTEILGFLVGKGSYSSGIWLTDGFSEY